MSKARILVVEDERIVAEDLRRSLERIGYSVCAVVASGEEAIKQAELSKPELILMDIVLRGKLSGIDAAAKIRTRFDIPVVYLTAYSDEATLERAKLTDPFGYILKPFDQKELYSVIEMALYKHQVEMQLRLGEERLRRVIQNMPAMMDVFDEHGNVIVWNRECERVTGYKAEEIVGNPEALKILYPDTEYRERLLAKWAECGYEFRDLECDLTCKDGSIRTIVWSNISLRYPIPGWAAWAIGVDITERKRVEEAHRESEDRYKSTIDSIDDAIHVVDNRLRILLTNKKFSQWNKDLGLKADPIGKEIFDVYPFLSQNARNEYRQVFTTGEVLVSEENTMIGEQTLITETRKIPVFNRGKVSRVITIIRDITERKQLEQQLVQSQKMEAIGRLAGGVAHDFNNLLTAILGGAELVLENLAPGEQVHADVKQIQKVAERAALLTRQLLAFSRKQAFKPKLLDLNSIVASAEKMFHRLIGEDIHLGITSGSKIDHVKADPGQIEQVIMNLAVNARDAMPEGGTLTIKTENVTLDYEQCSAMPEARPGKFVCLTVSDTGIGMNDATIAHIFEPFFSTKGSKGTGLGLSTVYGIVKQHDGWINVFSEPGKGSTVKIFWPVFPIISDDEIEESLQLQKHKGSGERILLVEDEEIVRKFAARILRENGYVVVEAQSMDDALSIFESRNNEFHLLFSDVVLPGKSGIQLADQLLARSPDLPVLLSSGYSDHKSQWQLIREREFQYLQKPYSISDLLEAVRNMMKQGCESEV